MTLLHFGAVFVGNIMLATDADLVLQVRISWRLESLDRGNSPSGVLHRTILSTTPSDKNNDTLACLFFVYFSLLCISLHGVAYGCFHLHSSAKETEWQREREEEREKRILSYIYICISVGILAQGGSRCDSSWPRDLAELQQWWKRNCLGIHRVSG